MKPFFVYIFIFLFYGVNLKAQLICKASEMENGAYQTITSSGLQIESPDCVHSDFGPHITQVFDSLLNRYVFAFHSHIFTDNDRCLVFDRVRMEIKGGPGSSEEAKHTLNTTSYYRWKFKIPDNFTGSSSFCHIFQNKIFGGDDSSYPLITITPRAGVLEIIHNGGDSGNDLGVVASANLELFKGKWIEAYVRQFHSENGKLEIILRDLISDKIVLSYINEDIDLWRTGAEYDRPKWGVYRKKNVLLKDEIIKFADFCITEQNEELCPSETIEIIDTIPPSIPQNFLANNIMIHSLNLHWDASTDNIGVATYHVFQDGINVWKGPELNTTISNLEGSTNYMFTISSQDFSGNNSEQSIPIMIETENSEVFPGLPENPFPQDNAENILTQIILRWESGNNTETQNIYFGITDDLEFIHSQQESFYAVNLESNTKYFWRIGQQNENGETLGPIWTFYTGDDNPDYPWKVYRANERMHVETNFMELNEMPPTPNLDEIINDPNGSENKIYGFWDDGEEKFRWRYNYNPNDTAITLVARIKAINPEVNCICYFEIRGFGFREKIRVNRSTIKLERSLPLIEETIPFDFNKEFHIIRITMRANKTQIFLDENPIAFASGFSNDVDENYYFEIGKSGTNECGGYIDWLTLMDNVIYSPDDGPALPADLFLSSDATLTEIKINGIPIPNFNPYQFEYDINIEGNTIPIIEYSLSSELSEIQLENPEFVPNSNAIIRVIAQDEYTIQTYKINYLESTSINGLENNNSILLYPNPTKKEIIITLLNERKGQAEIYNALGIRMDVFKIQNETIIDVSKYPDGLYYFVFNFNSNERIVKKILKLN